MDVTFTGSWYDETAEKEGANHLIARGCKLISQHADSWGAPTACEDSGIPNVSYNGSTVNACPNTFIISSRINWKPYFDMIIKDSNNIPVDYVGTFATGSVELTEVNEKAAAAGTVTAVTETINKFKNGEIKVFDTETFTENGNKLTTFTVEDTEVVKDGAFMESTIMSAPYFDINIDGITLLDNAF